MLGFTLRSPFDKIQNTADAETLATSIVDTAEAA
jgi:hypothetical protein